MKNLKNKFLTLATVASMVFLFSCGDEDVETPAPALPTISVSTTVNGTAATSPLTVYPGDSVGFSVAITAAGGFDSYIIYQSVDGGTATRLVTYTRLDLDVPVGTASVSDGVGTIVEASSVGSTITFEFEVVDDASQTATAPIVMEVESPAARSYTAILLYAPVGDATANKTSETFFSTSNGSTYSMKTINESSDPLSANVDFGYLYGENTGATLSDPASYPFAYGQAAWGKRNITTFRRTTLNASAFAEVTNFASIEETYAAATAADADAGIEAGLAVGEVLAFATDASKTGGSKKGLILVKAFSGEATNLGKIELEILVQD
jgi:hypothetical protein